MDKFVSVTKAKQDVKMLTSYINLWESYEADTVYRKIIKEYALLSSLEEVANRLNLRGCRINGRPIESDDVRSVLKERPKDDLHKIVRSGYLRKTKSKR
ncbi:hypothetical protein ABEV54_18320 [Peribacillus psychrosaccharolyticus]|uniref:hypothetical protein n=1 Tax=Peribacillus psychrosaccharolyticus TaxID=1407 RepID=UPI003D2ACDCC